MQQPVQCRIAATDRARPARSEDQVQSKRLERARKGCPEAWAQLYRQHFPMIYRRIKLLTGKMGVAEELSQEVFVQAMLHIAKFRGESKFSTWLFGIAHNLVRNHWRQVQSSQTAHERLGRLEKLQRGGSLDQHLLDRQRIEAVYAALETLPDNLRVVFVFRYFEGMSSAEIAQALNLSVNNVDARTSRARRRIKNVLGEKGWIAVRGSSR